MTSFSLPGDFNTLLSQAQSHQQAGRFALAYQAYLRCTEMRPDHPMLAAVAGNMASRSGRPEEAVRLLERAAKLNPSSDDIQHDLARMYRMVGRFDDAHRAIDAAIRIRPEKPNFRAVKGELYQMTGDLDQAWSTLEPVLSKAGAIPAVATLYVRLAAKRKHHEQAIVAARSCVALPSTSLYGKINLLFGIATLLDDLGRYEEAFHAFEEANRAPAIDWDPAKHTALVDRLVQSWTADAVASLPVGDAQTNRPIFIIGMPRSGTTLVEQMISSLPGVYGAGELNDMSLIAKELEPRPYRSMPFLSTPDSLRKADLRALAARYLDRLSSHSSSAIRVTDKLPNNGLNVGLIRTLFPNAAIINCRRDPLDTCVSCFTQHFDGSLPFTYDLAHCGRFHREYERVMDHWRTLYGNAVYDVVYEDLVADPEKHARAMVGYLGLPWDDACLRFHESTRVARTASIDQVRQKVYTSSIGRYQRFDPWLGPLKQSLGLA